MGTLQVEPGIHTQDHQVLAGNCRHLDDWVTCAPDTYRALFEDTCDLQGIVSWSLHVYFNVNMLMDPECLILVVNETEMGRNLTVDVSVYYHLVVCMPRTAIYTIAVELVIMASTSQVQPSSLPFRVWLFFRGNSYYSSINILKWIMSRAGCFSNTFQTPHFHLLPNACHV